MIQKNLEKMLKNSSIPRYSFCCLDESFNVPISLDINFINSIKHNFIHPNKKTVSKKIFDWVHNEIIYGDSKRSQIYRHKVGYRTAFETVYTKEGVCGEMSYLYVAIARCMGIKSNYVHVTNDINNKKVNHACAVIWVPEIKFVDVAYHKYDINHKKYQILTDFEMIQHFNSWR